MLAICSSSLAIIQNKYGQFSDIRGFYGLHFADGQHHWPFSTHTLIGSSEPIHAVEYPVLTGLIMWFFSFFIEPSQFGWLYYFRLTAIFQAVVFALTVASINKLVGRKYSMIFAVTPAVLYSLNRNWDIWAILPMILTILYYEKKKYRTSAILLAISIATKFFPLVLLFPIAIKAYREENFNHFVKFTKDTLVFWATINVPIALTNFEGWAYFYTFNFKRGLGSASVWDISSRLGIPIPNSNSLYILLNVAIFILVGLFLLKIKEPLSIKNSAYFVMFAFMLFGKQYSMQYVIWLAALALITIENLEKSKQKATLLAYIFWQASELLFQYSFFQNILTNTYANTETPAKPQISSTFYGLSGLFRYLMISGFTILLASYFVTKPNQSHGIIKK